MTPLDKLVALAPAIGAMHHPSARDMQQELNDVIAELRRAVQRETGVRAAWAAVVDALYEVRPDWDETAGKSSMENAVATIRSMAAQCSAQPAPALPIAWPKPVERRELDMLLWSIGYLQGIGLTDAAKSLDVTLNWLRDNGCDQQIR